MRKGKERLKGDAAPESVQFYEGTCFFQTSLLNCHLRGSAATPVSKLSRQEYEVIQTEVYWLQFPFTFHTWKKALPHVFYLEVHTCQEYNVDWRNNVKSNFFPSFHLINSIEFLKAVNSQLTQNNGYSQIILVFFLMIKLGLHHISPYKV